MSDFERRLTLGDTSLFEHLPSQTSERDRASLLLLHNVCRQLYGTFRYLEIGSHLGGSLQVLIADKRCTSIVSIDSRPSEQPDSALESVSYPDNSTARMVELLSRVPNADLAKLRTIDASTEDLRPDGLAADLCLIDGEHTDEAALRDARFCRAVIGPRGIITFHDRRRVRGAIETFCAELLDVEFREHRLPERLFAVEIGPPWFSESDKPAGGTIRPS